MVNVLKVTASLSENPKLGVRVRGPAWGTDNNQCFYSVLLLGICVICTETENVTELLSNPLMPPAWTMPPAKLGAWQPQPCWGLTSVSQHLKMKQACGVKIIVILITVFVVVENALTPWFSKSHSWVLFSVNSVMILKECCYFKHKIGSFNSWPLVTVLIHDFCCFKHKFGFVTPCNKDNKRCWCIWEVCLP